MKKLINTFIPILFYITIWAICPFGLFMRFAIGSAVYVFIEVMYDNTTDRWMAVMGGSLFVFCGSFDEWFMVPNLAYWFLIALTIVIIEYIGGKPVSEDKNFMRSAQCIRQGCFMKFYLKNELIAKARICHSRGGGNSGFSVNSGSQLHDFVWTGFAVAI